MIKFKQIFCKHNYKPWANIHGDLVNDFNGDRTILLCSKCHRRKYIKNYIKSPLNANNIFNYLSLNKKKDPFIDNTYISKAIEDKELYNELWGEDIN